jgi:hypothetical protein
MITFRKHAPESTRRPNSLLNSRSDRARAAALLMLLLLAAPWASAAPRQKEGAKSRDGQAPAAAPGKATDGAQTATAEAPAAESKIADSKIPVRVTRVNTPEGPGVFATIGEFPEDLNEGGQDFLKREFFEHFASDVLGLGESGAERATLKVALLPQEKDNQREGDFRLGKVSGHMVVLVEKRRVLIACTFSETEEAPQLMAE